MGMFWHSWTTQYGRKCASHPPEPVLHQFSLSGPLPLPALYHITYQDPLLCPPCVTSPIRTPSSAHPVSHQLSGPPPLPTLYHITYQDTCLYPPCITSPIRTPSSAHPVSHHLSGPPPLPTAYHTSILPIRTPSSAPIRTPSATHHV